MESFKRLKLDLKIKTIFRVNKCNYKRCQISVYMKNFKKKYIHIE